MESKITNKEIGVMKQEHMIWMEWHMLPEQLRILHFKEPVCHKWHYIYYLKHQKKPKEISLVQFRHDLYDPFHWEIYCLEGNIFEDVRRFRSREEAEIAIKDFLKPSYWRRFVNHFREDKR